MNKLYTKPTLVQRIKAFWSEFWIPIMCVTPVVLLVGTVIYAVLNPAPYLRAPVEFCTAAYTGRTKVEQYPVTSCASYDQNMNCIVPVTTYQDYTMHETNVKCDWNEWRQ